MSSHTMQNPQHSAHPPKQRSRFGRLLRELWFQVVLGAVLGIAVGLLLPSVGKQLTPLSDWFIALVKMIVIPVVFCVVSLGIASMDSLRKAGRIGVKALGYFIALSLVSMLIGLVVANVFRPGEGMNIDPSTAGRQQGAGGRQQRLRRPRVRQQHHPGITVRGPDRPHHHRRADGLHRVRCRPERLRRIRRVPHQGHPGPVRCYLQNRQLGHAPCPHRHVRRTRGRRGQLRHSQPPAAGLPRPAVHRNLHRVRRRGPGHYRPCLRTEHLHGDALLQGRTADRPEHLLQRSGPPAADQEARKHGRRQVHRGHRDPVRVLLQPRRIRRLPDHGLRVPGPGRRHGPLLGTAARHGRRHDAHQQGHRGHRRRRIHRPGQHLELRRAASRWPPSPSSSASTGS